MYLVTTIMHYCMVLLCEKVPSLQSIHAAVLVGTYSSFCLNDPDVYPKRSEHLSLLVGFIALQYLSSTFVSTNYIHTTVGYAMSTGLVTYYYSTGLQYDFIKIFPGMLAMTFATTMNSYYIEMKDKQEFLEKR